MLALVFPDYQSGWNAENDYSNADLLKHPEEYVITDRIPVYQNGVLISGVEPDGTKPTKPDTPDPAERGDVNADQSVTVADLVLLIRHLTGDTVLKKAQAVPADVDENSMVNGMDAACLRQMLAEQ